MDFAWITSRLAVGSQIDTHEEVVDLVAGKRITHVLSLRHDLDEWPLLMKHVRREDYLWNPSPDGADSRPKPPLWFYDSVEFAMRAFSTWHARLLVHCGGGISRSPATCYAILLALGLPPNQADLMVITARPRYDRFYRDCAEQAVATYWCQA